MLDAVRNVDVSIFQVLRLIVVKKKSVTSS